MHRLLVGAERGIEVDHKNRDGLDCRRENLRVATRSQNASNSPSIGGTSKYKGVNWHRARGKWAAYIKHNMVRKYLGLFLSEQDAACAYDAAAIRMHGEFAYLNFPHMETKHPEFAMSLT